MNTLELHDCGLCKDVLNVHANLLALDVYTMIVKVMKLPVKHTLGLVRNSPSKQISNIVSMKQTRPRWMQITSLDTLKTKLGHCIVMIFTVKLFEKSKTVRIVSSVDLLLYSVAIFLSAASLYVLQQLHASQTPSKN